MRRNDREITDRNEILEIMNRCDVCRLALNDDGYPYILPLNFGLLAEGEDITLLFHGASEGRKFDVIAKDDRASFEMDCKHEFQYFPEKQLCTMAYESVIGQGHVRILPDEEKLAAMDKLMLQYHPEGHSGINPSVLAHTTLYSLKVERMTAKRKLPKLG